MSRLRRIVLLTLGLAALPAAATTIPPFTRTVLTNGAVLLVSEQRALPLVSIEVMVDAGARRDPRGRMGLANLTADLLNEGTRRHDAASLAAAVDALGARMATSAGIDTASLDLRVLRGDLEAGLELLADVLLRPTFPAAELVRRREAVLASMRAAEDSPGTLAYRGFLQNVFGDDPYGHPVEGWPKDVRNIERSEIIAFYDAHYRPERAIITVVGDVGTDEIRSLLEKSFAGWQRGTVPPFVHPAAAAVTPKVAIVDKPLSQVTVMAGHRGVARSHPDYFAIEVMNHILGGGGFGSRLMNSVRTRAGLAYSVSSAFTMPLAPGSFRIVLQTKRESLRQALQLICSELLRMRDAEVQDEELDDAKRYITGNFPLLLDGNEAIASFLANVELFGLGADYARSYIDGIRGVTKADVQRVAREHVRPDDMVLSLVGQTDWPASEPLRCSTLASAAATSEQ